MTDNRANFPVRADSVDSLLVRVLTDLQVEGTLTDPVIDHLSVGSDFGKKLRRTKELIGYQFVLTNPRARIVYNRTRKFNLAFAVAQFLWNISGSNRVDPILFYNRRAVDFSDDGDTVRGSSYWGRLTGQGDNQIQRILRNLRDDPSTRRTFATIFRAEDNSGITRDVPCPIGVQYFIREERLLALTYMRSNSAALMMPYNIFFFTMLQELMARELEVEVGDYLHFCGSLHYYDDEQVLVDTILNSRQPERFEMRPMPEDTTIGKISMLVEFEEKLRLSSRTSLSVEEWIGEAGDFDEYWSQICYLLIWHKLMKEGQTSEAGQVSSLLNREYRPLIQQDKSTQDRSHPMLLKTP